MIVEQATIGDLPVILAMRQEASDWPAKKGIDQWAVAWPSPRSAVGAHPFQHPCRRDVDDPHRRRGDGRDRCP